MENVVLLGSMSAVGPLSEERVIRQGELDMRLIINRANGHMRFMDYRVGNYDAKRDLLDSLARKEGLRKIFTVVEKQDSNAWRGIGFCREGVFPGFFRTADAYVMSRLYDSAGAAQRTKPLRASPEEQLRFPERKLRKPAGLTITAVEDEGQRDELLQRLNGDVRSLPFAGAKAPDVVLHGRARRNQGWALAEVDDSFAHATISLAPAPTGDKELVLSAYVASTLMAELAERSIKNIFGLSPVADRWSNELFSGLGFKVTGRLAGHLRNGEGYTNALLWHCRLAQPE